MNHKKSGIYKGVSEAVYPDDILSDQELMGSDLATIGAWCGKVLTAMWRAKPKTGSITDTIEGYSRFWGCDIAEAERIIGVIELRKIGTVSRDCHTNVTLICRRLERRHKASEEARLRKQAERDRKQCHGDVTPQKTGPSSPSPFPSPSLTSLKAPPTPSLDPEPEPNNGTADTENDPPPKDRLALDGLVKAYMRKQGHFFKSPESVERHFYQAMFTGIDAQDILDEIKAIPAGDTQTHPWVIKDKLLEKRKAADQAGREKAETVNRKQAASRKRTKLKGLHDLVMNGQKFLVRRDGNRFPAFTIGEALYLGTEAENRVITAGGVDMFNDAICQHQKGQG